MKNTFVKVLSMMMALMMVVGMFSMITVSAAGHEHTKGALIETVKPTCQTLGYSRYTCADSTCGQEWVTDVIYPSAEYHEVIEYAAQAATCLAPAMTAGAKCKYCSYTPAGVTAPAPVAGSQLAHQFVGAKVAATCTDGAKFVNTCKLCNKTAEQINAIAGIQWVGGQSFAQYEAKPITGEGAKGHNYNWVVVSAPSNIAGACTDGLTRGTCANCGDVKESPIPVTHDYSINLNPDGVTCAEYKSGFMCKYCGKLKDAVKNDADKVGVHTVGYTVPSGTIFDVNNLPAKNAAGTVKFTIAELKNLGFTEGQVISKDATCKAAGTLLVVCSCGKVSLKPVAVKAHSFTTYGDVQWPDDCTKPAVRVSVCNYGCGTKDEKVVVAAAHAAHTTKDTVTEPTCTALGYTETVCTNKFVVNGIEVTCAYATGKHSYKDPAGHDWSDPIWVSGNCGSADYTKKCNTCKVDYETTTGNTVAEPDANKAHKYGAEVTVPANCKDASYKSKVCQICGHEVKTPIKDAVADPNVHVYTTGAALLKEVPGKVEFVAGKTPSCTKDGEAIVWCIHCGGGMKTVNTGKAPHDIKENCYKTTAQDGKVTLHYTQLDSKCNEFGYKADGKYCEDCGYEAKPATQIAKNPNVHGGKTVTPVGAPVGATCLDGAYQMYNTDCCGLVKTYTNNGVKAAHDFTSDPTKSVVPFKAPTCTEAGNHQYNKCQWCGVKQPLSTVATGCTYGCSADVHAVMTVTDNHVIPALGHDWKEIKEVAETCTTTGTKAHEECATCKIVRFNGVEYKDKNDAKFIAAAQIGKHSTLFQFTISEEEAKAKPATCVSTGLRANTAEKPFYCTKCDDESAWIIPKTNHVLDEDNAITVNCTYTFVGYDANHMPIVNIDYKLCNEESAVVLSCTVCSYKTAVYQAAAKSGHTLSNYIEKPLTGSEKSCTFAVKQYKQCTDPSCEYKTPEEIKTAPTGCYTTKGVEGGQKFPLTYNCNTIENCIGWSCDVCGETVTKNADGKYVFSNDNNAANPNKHTMSHRVVTETAPDTCTTAGYTIQYCGDCNYTDNVTANDYKKTTVVNDTLKGHYLDRNPNNEAGVLVVEKVANSFIKYICPDCNTEQVKDLTPTPTFAVTGAVSANKVTASNDVTYTVTYSGVAQTFKTIKIEVKFDANKFDFVEASSALTENVFTSVENGVVGITLVSKTDMTTAAAGTALVTLNFTAKKYAMGAAEFGVKNGAATIATAKTTVVGLGNATGTGYVTAEDALAILATDKYNAEFDINGDGMVDLIDVALVGTFAASNQTAKDYLVMLGTYAEIQATIDALYADGKLADCNKDGIVTINDYYALTEKVDKALADLGAYTNINFASVEEFVMNTMRGMI